MSECCKESLMVNKVHERSLRIAGSDNQSSIRNWLRKFKKITIRQRNLQGLMTEMYKLVNGFPTNYG